MGGNEVAKTSTTRFDVSQVPPQGGYVAKRCPVRAQNDTLQPAERVPVGSFLQRLFDRGNAFEAEVFQPLLAQGALLIGPREDAAWTEATMRAMTDRVPVILGGQLPTDLENRRNGRPDILIAAPGGGYRPADVKSHNMLTVDRTRFPAKIAQLEAPQLERATVDEKRYAKKKDGDLLQLAHYQRMLEAEGFAATDGRHGAIIGSEALMMWFDLDTAAFRTPSSSGKTKLRSVMEVYDFEFAFRLDIIAVAQQHAVDLETELLVVPVRIPECGGCPWEEHCLTQMQAGAGDVSLVPGVGWKQWKIHDARGIHDRAQLAALEPQDARYEGSGLTGLAEQIDQARAWCGPDPFYLRRGRSRLDLPRADIELDVDLESMDGGVYLWGALRTDTSTGASSYHPFVTWEPLTPGVETSNFLAFWRWLSSQLDEAAREGRSLRAYFYSSIETTNMRRIAAAAGVEREVERFIASDSWIDLYRVMSEQIVTGTRLGLKMIAPLAGFRWEVEDPGGGESMIRYEAATHPTDPGVEDARAWLLAYNRNDVEATRAVRAALRDERLRPIA